MGNEPDPSQEADVNADANAEGNANDADLADENGGAGDISPVDFNMLVLSLNASALLHLGETEAASAGLSTGPSGPSSGIEVKLDLPMARNAIDMLCMLEVKTRGNLTGEEEHLLNQVLFDLRLRYARAAAR